MMPREESGMLLGDIPILEFPDIVIVADAFVVEDIGEAPPAIVLRLPSLAAAGAARREFPLRQLVFDEPKA